MPSASAPTPAPGASPDASRDRDDRTARARIRDAAVRCFGDRGVDGTSLKVIAEEAGVSQALIVHHFGSKVGLRVACDEYVAAEIRGNKLRAMEQGPKLDPLAAVRESKASRSILRYLARTLTDGAPQVAALLDEMVDDAIEYSEEGVRTGLMKPTEHPRGRATVLVLWSVGLLTLHEHLERMLGVDLLGEPEELGGYLLPVIEMLSRGVMADVAYERAKAVFPPTPEQADAP